MEYRQVQVIGGKGSGPGQFSGALRGIACDGQGRLYAAGDTEVKVFDTSGRITRRWTTSRAALSVAVAEDGSVYVGELRQVEIFHADREFLRVQRAEHYPRATDYIAEMITLVQRLEQKGVAYKADDNSVYFAIDKFPTYGTLSRLDTREIKSGARVSQDEYAKENAQDFALWK
ncbi:MAG: hypothetical protein NTY38_12585, partial [Acidobacteria bacterium]|nr:hypothetical protein [Acidobacteriota bacterium]